MASDFIKAQPGVVEAAVQSLLECRRKARSIEESVESLIPLLEPSANYAAATTESIREGAAKLAHLLKVLYDRNAKEAFGKREKVAELLPLAVRGGDLEGHITEPGTY